MYRVLIVVLLALLCASAPARAQQNYDIHNWYWIATDTSPTAQVFSSASGTFVANNDSTYLSWLSLSTNNQNFITGAADNGSGAVRLTMSAGTGNYQTNQYWNVAGTGLYDLNWKITVIDATHIDLQGSTYSAPGTLNTSYVSGPTNVPTAASIYSTIDAFNQTLAIPPTATQGGSTVSNPVAAWNNITGVATPITMPKADLPGSMALGKTFYFSNASALNTAVALVAADGSTPIAVMPAGSILALTPQTNSSTKGTFAYSFVAPYVSSRLAVEVPFIDCNATGDTVITVPIPASGRLWRVSSLAVQGVSGAFSAAQIGFYGAASQGAPLIAAQQAISGITSTSVNTVGNLAPLTITNQVAMNVSTMYANIGTPQSASCRINAYVEFQQLPQ